MTLVKDYPTVTTSAIKEFTNCLCQVDFDADSMELPLVLELLFFLHYEGKTKISGLEEKIADYLYNELSTRVMPADVFLMVACFLSILDNPSLQFEDKKANQYTAESVKNVIFAFDVDSEPYSSIIKRGFVIFNAVIQYKLCDLYIATNYRNLKSSSISCVMSMRKRLKPSIENSTSTSTVFVNEFSRN